MLDSVVQLVIGPKKEVFYMHKGLLCSVAALEGGFKEVCDHSSLHSSTDRITASGVFGS